MLCVVVASDFVHHKNLPISNLGSHGELQNKVSISPVDVPVFQVSDVGPSKNELSLVDFARVEAVSVHDTDISFRIDSLGKGNS